MLNRYSTSGSISANASLAQVKVFGLPTQSAAEISGARGDGSPTGTVVAAPNGGTISFPFDANWNTASFESIKVYQTSSVSTHSVVTASCDLTTRTGSNNYELAFFFDNGTFTSSLVADAVGYGLGTVLLTGSFAGGGASPSANAVKPISTSFAGGFGSFGCLGDNAALGFRYRPTSGGLGQNYISLKSASVAGWTITFWTGEKVEGALVPSGNGDISFNGIFAQGAFNGTSNNVDIVVARLSEYHTDPAARPCGIGWWDNLSSGVGAETRIHLVPAFTMSDLSSGFHHIGVVGRLPGDYNPNEPTAALAGQQEYYVDGVFIGIAVNSLGVSGTTVTGLGSLGNGPNYNFGDHQPWGILDAVKFFMRPMSASEVADDMNKTGSGDRYTCDGPYTASVSSSVVLLVDALTGSFVSGNIVCGDSYMRNSRSVMFYDNSGTMLVISESFSVYPDLTVGNSITASAPITIPTTGQLWPRPFK